MLKVNCIGTGSRGNCYVLTIGVDSLILECGSSLFPKLKRSMNYDFSHVKGALISHSHKDHCGDVKHLLKSGIHVLSTKDVFSDCGDYLPFCHTAEHLKGYKFGCFRVIPLAMRHDVDCFAYIIQTDTEKILFVIDSPDIPYNLPQFDYLLIESNYSRKIIDLKLYEGSLPNFLYKRILHSHMSLETAQVFIESQKRNLKGILLLHLSSDNSDAEEFVERVSKQTGVLTFAAHNNTEYDFL